MRLVFIDTETGGTDPRPMVSPAASESLVKAVKALTACNRAIWKIAEELA